MDAESRPFGMDRVVSEVETRLARYADPVEVSVLGSAAQGVGEARHAEFAITAAKDVGLIHSQGRPLRTVPVGRLVEEPLVEIDGYYAAGKRVVVDQTRADQAARWLSENQDDAA